MDVAPDEVAFVEASRLGDVFALRTVIYFEVSGLWMMMIILRARVVWSGHTSGAG